MVSKVQERIFAEAAIALLGKEWLLVDIPEPLDFAVDCAEGTFGLEVTQLFAGGTQTHGSSLKKSESENQRLVRAVAKRYYELGGSAVSAKFLGTLAAEKCESISQSMVDRAPKYPGPGSKLTLRDLKVFMSPVPTSFGHYSRWLLVDDRVGWVNKVASADLQAAVDKKARNLEGYRQKHEDIDLLIVADRTFSSGKLLPSEGLAVQNPGFRSIYFMSYPESIQRVG